MSTQEDERELDRLGCCIFGGTFVFMAILFAIAFLVVSSISGAEVSRQRVYHSPYQPGVIIALLVDSAIDAYQAGGGI